MRIIGQHDILGGKEMKAEKHKYKIDTQGQYGVFYRWATSARAALNRIYLHIYGTTYDIPWQADYWTVTEIS